MPIKEWSRKAAYEDFKISKRKLLIYPPILIICIVIIKLHNEVAFLYPLAGIAAIMIINSLGILLIKEIRMAHPKLNAPANKWDYISPRDPLWRICWLGLIIAIIRDGIIFLQK